MLNIGKDVDLVKLAQVAYDLSRPQGMGYLHYKDEPLTDAEAKEIIARERPNGGIALSMDYVHGRACKLTVRRNDDGSLSLEDKWFDHGDFDELIAKCGLTATKQP